MYRKLIGAICLGAALVSCNSASDKGSTESGLNYEFVERSSTSLLDSGMVATVNLHQTIMNGTDTIMDRGTDKPVPVPVAGASQDLLMEGFLMMGKGDSAIFSGNATDFFKQLPPTIPNTSTVRCEVRIIETFADMTAYQEFEKQKQEERNAEEDQLIKEYLAANNLEGNFTDSGLCYVITEEGSGPKPEVGDILEVHYTGTLMETGDKFDSSLDRGKTFDFPVGKRRVIAGWDEGFQQMKEGSKGILIIPSRLGYGTRGAGGAITPNSILRFDVEFVSNKGKDAPVTPPKK